MTFVSFIIKFCCCLHLFKCLCHVYAYVIVWMLYSAQSYSFIATHTMCAGQHIQSKPQVYSTAQNKQCPSLQCTRSIWSQCQLGKKAAAYSCFPKTHFPRPPPYPWVTKASWAHCCTMLSWISRIHNCPKIHVGKSCRKVNSMPKTPYRQSPVSLTDLQNNTDLQKLVSVNKMDHWSIPCHIFL